MSNDVASFSKTDLGKGRLRDYKFDLVPNSKRVTMVLAGSDPAQDELARVASADSLEAFVSPRTAEEERTDAPVPVRFFVDSRMSGIVGWVPRGLEPVIFETLTRLERVGKKRIPARIDKTRYGYRVSLLIGLTK